MDKFLGAFSLQNFLRQFFCGVVFFVPFFLYETPLVAWLERGHSNGDWSSPKVAALGVLACIIGTFIYHWEKNLYSYCIQGIFEKNLAKQNIIINYLFAKEERYNVILVIMAIIMAVAVLCSYYIAAVLSFAVILVIFLHKILLCQKLQERTRMLWIVESCIDYETSNRYCGDSRINLSNPISEASMIAHRLAKWSDFIHCVQSCCFAWILSEAIIYLGVFHVSILEKIQSYDFSTILHDKAWKFQIVIPLCILIIECVIDWHRYQHVAKITNHLKEPDWKYTASKDSESAISTSTPNTYASRNEQKCEIKVNIDKLSVGAAEGQQDENINYERTTTLDDSNWIFINKVVNILDAIFSMCPSIGKLFKFIKK